jgi:hypothetical protein
LSDTQQRLWQLLDSLEPGTAVMQAHRWATDIGEATRMLASYERRRQRISQEMRARSERASQELAGLHHRMAERERELVERERQLHVASRRCARRESELLAAQERCSVAEERLRVADHWLSQVQGSFSWRATQPLRDLKRRLLASPRPDAVRKR